jgi:hypothetical protein
MAALDRLELDHLGAVGAFTASPFIDSLLLQVLFVWCEGEGNEHAERAEQETQNEAFASASPFVSYDIARCDPTQQPYHNCDFHICPILTLFVDSCPRFLSLLWRQRKHPSIKIQRYNPGAGTSKAAQTIHK